MSSFHLAARFASGVTFAVLALPASVAVAADTDPKDAKAEKTALVVVAQPRIEKDEPATLRTVCLEGEQLWLQKQMDRDRMGNDGPLHACYKVIVQPTGK